MTASHYALFETAIGTCGIVWGKRGITAVQLPESSLQNTRARLLEQFPQARNAEPPPAIRTPLEGIVKLLGGEPSDLSAAPLDMSAVSEFYRQVYEAARRIGAGCTLTYGEIASEIGMPGAARAVGQALGRNPFPIIIPCHRVVAAGGKLGGFSAHGGTATKMRLLAIERAATGATRDAKR
jgi:methylated-DNA-[protein]-cysteine S-methyltransferase